MIFLWRGAGDCRIEFGEGGLDRGSPACSGLLGVGLGGLDFAGPFLMTVSLRWGVERRSAQPQIRNRTGSAAKTVWTTPSQQVPGHVASVPIV